MAIENQNQKPMVMNGAVLTDDVLREINYLQTGGTGCGVPEEITNEGYKEYEKQLDEITDYLIEVIAYSDKEEDRSREVDLLASVYFLKATLKQLRAPEGKLEM